jgi:hypothetical protein
MDRHLPVSGWRGAPLLLVMKRVEDYLVKSVLKKGSDPLLRE